jgi:protein MBA1
MENSGLRQVVVRLVSRQHLATWTDEEARKAVKGRLRDLRAAGKEPSPALLAVENEDAAKAVAAMRRGYNPISAHKIYKALAEDGVQDKVKKVESEAVEYLVLQRRMIEGVEEDWMVWGFAEESTEKVRKRDAKVMRDLEEYQKAQPAQV